MAVSADEVLRQRAANERAAAARQRFAKQREEEQRLVQITLTKQQLVSSLMAEMERVTDTLEASNWPGGYLVYVKVKRRRHVPFGRLSRTLQEVAVWKVGFREIYYAPSQHAFWSVRQGLGGYTFFTQKGVDHLSTDELKRLIEAAKLMPD